MNFVNKKNRHRIVGRREARDLEPCPFCGKPPVRSEINLGALVACEYKKCPVRPRVYVWEEEAPTSELRMEIAAGRWNTRNGISTKQAFDALASAMREDAGYAWSWHCNVAMAAVDEGVDRETANKVANTFMNRCFKVEEIEKEIPSPEPDPDYEWHDVETDPPPLNIWVEVKFRSYLIMEGIYFTGGGGLRWMERSGNPQDKGMTPMIASDKITHWRRIKPKSRGE